MLGVSSCASLRRFVVGTPCSCALRASGPSFVSSRSCSRRASAISFASTSANLGHLVVEHEQAHVRFLAQRVERLETAAGAAALHVVGRVGETLHLVEHEARHHQVAAQHTGARQRQQLAVHHDRRVDEQAVARVERLRAHERRVDSPSISSTASLWRATIRYPT